jgi:hypothetical protein
LRVVDRRHILAIVVLFALFGAFIAVWTHVPLSPYTPLGGDYVRPDKTLPGGQFIVSRSFRWKQPGVALVERTLIGGYCTHSYPRTGCDIISLPSTYFAVDDGDYIDFRRPFTIPSSAVPGSYALDYTMIWWDFLGRPFSIKLPSLSIEVLK